MNSNSNQPPAIPDWRDPRWIVLVSLTAFAGYLIQNPSFNKTFIQVLVALATAGLADFILNTVIGKKPVRFPLSSMTSASGVGVLMWTPYYWPYVVVPLLAVFSKRLIKWNGRHIFNPNNFGIVVAVVMLGSSISSTAGRWTDSPPLFFAVIAIGVFVTYLVNRLALALPWVASFTLFSLLAGWLKGWSWTQAMLPATDPIFYIYTFYHITDPVTTPRSTKGQILFGISLGVLDGILRSFEVIYSPFIALFIITAVQPLCSPSYWHLKRISTV